jgi:TPR repeat protein
MYYYGKGMTRDYHQALDWYRKAAAQGDAEAEYSVGYLYYHGDGVAQDYVEALRWYRKAADQDYAWAQDTLGVAYFQGNGVAQNYAEAVRWFRKAADQGDARGQYDLGLMYFDGKGVVQDRTEASRLFHEAAAKGDERARHALRSNKGHSEIGKIMIAWEIFASLFFGIVFLKPSKSGGTRTHIVSGLAALLLLCSLVMDLFWYSYIGHGHVYSSTSSNALYLARHFFRGVIVAALLSIVVPRSAEAVLLSAAALFGTFVAAQIVLCELRHVAPTVRLFCFVGFPVGMAILPAIFLWLDRNGNGRELDPRAPLAAK